MENSQRKSSNSSRTNNLVDSASKICLSQKLSHASLSISIIQQDCEQLIKTVTVYLMFIFTWITVVILELIHASMVNSRTPAFIRLQSSRFAVYVES